MRLSALLLTGAAALAGATYLHIRDAGAHHAPSGWEYPNECCSGHMDCQMIHQRNIEETDDGIRVTLAPGEHRHLPDGGSHLFPWKRNGTINSSIKDSGDNDWHVCVSRYSDWYCIYRPAGGV